MPPVQAQHPFSFTPMYWGTANFQWTYPPGKAPGHAATPARWWVPPSAGGWLSPVMAPLAHPRRSQPHSGAEVDVEPLVGALFARLPAAKRKRALAMLPHRIGTLAHTRRGQIRMLAPRTGRVAPPGPYVRPRVAVAVRKRDVAEIRALCWAYGNHIPGFEKACLPPRR
jgi:hypothetical protein